MTSPIATLSELKLRHRAMWAAGDYQVMVDRWLLPLGRRLVDAAGITPGVRVLDVAAGTGNAAIPAAQRGAQVVAGDLTPELIDIGRRRATAAGVDLDWVEADAEALPFEDESFDVVMSSIGVMFAPHHEASAAELIRVCRPGGTIALLSWTPEGMVGGTYRVMGAFAPPLAPGVQAPPLWGSEKHLRDLFGNRVRVSRQERDVLPVTGFAHPREYAALFRSLYGPAIAVRANAEKHGRAADFDAALDAFCLESNRGTDEAPVFEKEYLVTVGMRVA